MVRSGGHLGVGLRTHDDDDDVMRERGREGQGSWFRAAAKGVQTISENDNASRTSQAYR